MKKPGKSLRLTEQQRFTVSVCLMEAYKAAMARLDLTGPNGGYWLRQAGEVWDAYKAVTGYSLSKYAS